MISIIINSEIIKENDLLKLKFILSRLKTTFNILIISPRELNIIAPCCLQEETIPIIKKGDICIGFSSVKEVITIASRGYKADYNILEIAEIEDLAFQILQTSLETNPYA